MPKKAKESPATSAVPAPVLRDAAPLTYVGMEATPKGHVVVSLLVDSSGTVLERQTHCPPVPKQFAAITLAKVLRQRVLFPNGR